MISFQEFIVLIESPVLEKPGAEDFTPKDGGNSEKILNKMIEMAWNRYHSETKNFFQNLAEKDPEIKEAFSELEGKGPSQGDRVSAPFDDDKDTIVPPEADTSAGIEDGGGY